jgi:glycine cleavage system H lipoate-binding protein
MPASFLRRAALLASRDATTLAQSATGASSVASASAPRLRLAPRLSRATSTSTSTSAPSSSTGAAGAVDATSPLPPPLYTRTHEILRPESVSPDGSEITMTVGLTEHAFDIIGDVRAVEAVDLEEEAEDGDGARRRRAASAAGPSSTLLARLRWEGFKRTASDELYHASWANVSDARDVAVPFAATLVGLNAAAVREPYKMISAAESGWVARVTASRDAMRRAGSDALMSARAYEEMVEEQIVQDEAEASRSYP